FRLDSNVQARIKGGIQRSDGLNPFGCQYCQKAVAYQREPLQPGVQDVRGCRHGLWETARLLGWRGHRWGKRGECATEFLPETWRRWWECLLQHSARLLLPCRNLLALSCHQRLSACQSEIDAV